MSEPLLLTKLYIPPSRTGIVPRARLIERLNEGLAQERKLTLISAPAGFGKTTLLSEWIPQIQHPVAWLSLDEADNDPIRFWTYLIAACQSVVKEVGEAALDILRAPQSLPDDTIPTLLINDLTAQSLPLMLVLDDYHVIQNPSLHASISFLLDHLPHNLHLIVSTRADPPWPLARYRARNQLVEIRTHDLRFSLDEATEFLNRAMGLDLSAENLAALEERTEGWVAGLQLAALSMQGRSDMDAFIKVFTGSHAYIAEYLMDEVLKRQPDEMQSFLLKTSILGRLNAGLCEAVTDSMNGQDKLKALQQGNIFITPLDDQGYWFRYHHLFADLLQARLGQVLSGDAIRVLHQQAASWYNQNGYSIEAVNHTLAAKDFEAAAGLIEKYGNDVITRGELATYIQWTDALPGEILALHPQIIIAKIWALALVGAIRQVEPMLRQAEAQIERSNTPEARELAGFAAAIRAFFSMMAGEDDRALELAKHAERLLPERSVHARWLLPYTTGAAYRGQGKYEQAVKAFTRQVQMGDAYDNLVVWVTGTTGIALVQLAQGHLRAVSQVCRQGLKRLVEQGASGFGSLAKLETPLVEVLIEQNKLEEASQRLACLTARMQFWPMPTDRLHAYIAQIQLEEAKDNLEGAFRTLRTAKDLKDNNAVLMNLARSVDLWEIRLFLKKGGLAEAGRLMEALQPGTSRWIELRDQEQLLLARLIVERGRLEEAEKVLSPLAIDAENGKRKRALIETLILRSRVLAAQGNREAAWAVLTRALALAEPEGFVRIFVVEGDEMHTLLAELAYQLLTSSSSDSIPSQGYIAKLLKAFPTPSPPASVPSLSNQAYTLVEQLTSREFEILQLVAAGDSNQRIAEKLIITISAVKKHTSNIYGKLGVNSRTQAISRARQLGLLSKDD